MERAAAGFPMALGSQDLPGPAPMVLAAGNPRSWGIAGGVGFLIGLPVSLTCKAPVHRHRAIGRRACGGRRLVTTIREVVKKRGASRNGRDHQGAVDGGIAAHSRDGAAARE